MQMEKKTDKNQIVGFILIGLILVFFSWYNTTVMAPERELKEAAQKDSISAQAQQSAVAVAPDEAEAPEMAETSDTLVTPPIEDVRYQLENDRLTLEFSSRGGMPVGAFLKKYRNHEAYKNNEEVPLAMIDQNGYLAAQIGDWETGKLSYVGELDGQRLTLTANAPQGGQVAWIYTLSDDGYDLDIRFEARGIDGGNDEVNIIWNQLAMAHEKSWKTENMATQVYYYRENDYHTMSAGGTSQKEKDGVKWVGYKQQFFSAVLRSEGTFENAWMRSTEVEDDLRFTKVFESRLKAGSVANGQFATGLHMYIGPNKYEILKTYDYDYDKLIDFGWGIFGWIGRGVVVKIFNWLDNYHLNYGIIILIMALMIKIVLFPFMFTSYKSMAKMRVLKPEMDELNEKFKDKDPMKKQQAVMELYSKAGVNPLAGCLPQLVQLPILIAMFRFFPASIELRQKAFLWADDLSSFDVIYAWEAYVPLLSDIYGNHISLFTLLMAISTFAYTMLNNSLQGTNQQFPQIKYIMYLMPVMLLFWFNSYASGLSYYYFIANVTTFGQQFGIKAFIDEDAIHAKIQENKKNPKKKSRFAQALETQMEKQKNMPQNRRIKRQSGK
jgi:YidC/Oxa1 family membrane protein insertase